MENQTYSKDFHLLLFSIKSEYTISTAIVFFLLYLCGVFINSIIITVIYIDYQLHTPMYLFLCNLALVDICYMTITVPNLMYISLSGHNTMSFIQCFTQMYFYDLVAFTENVLIFIMAYDRFVAICDPLHYQYILKRKNCLLLASSAWVLGCLNSFLFTIPVSNMFFCHSHTINQFFCDPKALFKISCSGIKDYLIIIYFEILVFGLLPVTFCVTSYIKIISVILQIKSKDGRKKAFSTCSSHLIVIIIYYTTGVSVYMMPPSQNSSVTEIVLTVLYANFTPMINPLIYSLRNKDVKIALLRIMGLKQKFKQ